MINNRCEGLEAEWRHRGTRSSSLVDVAANPVTRRSSFEDHNDHVSRADVHIRLPHCYVSQRITQVDFRSSADALQKFLYACTHHAVVLFACHNVESATT
jgi:hypothetical protein